MRENVSTVDARLRTWIRLTLTLLDLWFQYGVQDVLVSAGVLKDLDLSEEKTAAEAEDREDDTGAIFRRRIFE